MRFFDLGRGEKSREIVFLGEAVMSDIGIYTSKSIDKKLSLGLKHLTLQQIHLIDETIGSVGEYGEVHLIVEKGRLRFLVKQTSVDALKYRPDRITEGK